MNSEKMNEIMDNIMDLFNPKWIWTSYIKPYNIIYFYHKFVYNEDDLIFELIENCKTDIITCKINEKNYSGVENIKYKIHSILFDYEFKIMQKELKITVKRIRYYDTIIKILTKKINIDIAKKILEKLN